MPDLTETRMTVVMTLTDMQIIREALSRATGDTVDAIVEALDLNSYNDFRRNLNFFTQVTGHGGSK